LMVKGHSAWMLSVEGLCRLLLPIV
jgi:hypothetical protein